MKRFLNLAFVLALVLGLGFGFFLFAAAGQGQQAEQATEQAAPAKEKQFLAFGGGPTGGTFNFFANKMSSIISHTYDYLDVSPKGSGGSAENLRTLDKASVDFGIVYSGDAYLGRMGQLVNDETKYENLRVISFLYGAPAQLVVRKPMQALIPPTTWKGKSWPSATPVPAPRSRPNGSSSTSACGKRWKRRNLGYSQARCRLLRQQDRRLLGTRGLPQLLHHRGGHPHPGEAPEPGHRRQKVRLL